MQRKRVVGGDGIGGACCSSVLVVVLEAMNTVSPGAFCGRVKAGFVNLMG
jgi:hypothetical protein